MMKKIFVIGDNKHDVDSSMTTCGRTHKKACSLIIPSS